MKESISLKFDNRVFYGSPEHFYHFMLGYLLPASEIIDHQKSLIDKRNVFIFRSCGPVMDKIIHEATQFLDIDYRIEMDTNNSYPGNCKTINVPRWDLWMMRNKWKEEIRKSPEVEKFLYRKTLLNELKTSLMTIKVLFTDRLLQRNFSFNLNDLSDTYLILKRSKQPDFYNKGGNAEIPTYGEGRRSLLNIESASMKLNQQNLPVRIFEPGIHTLAEQIHAFNNCKGIIGIRGAEFANLIWMKPGSKVIMFNPARMKKPHPQEEYAKLLDLEYHEIGIPTGKRLKLDSDRIATILK